MVFQVLDWKSAWLRCHSCLTSGFPNKMTYAFIVSTDKKYAQPFSYFLVRTLIVIKHGSKTCCSRASCGHLNSFMISELAKEKK
jgi:hypothetical protein